MSLRLVKKYRFGLIYIGQSRYFCLILPLVHLLLTYFGTFALVFTISVFRGMTNISNRLQFSSLSGTLDRNLLKIAQKCAQCLSLIYWLRPKKKICVVPVTRPTLACRRQNVRLKRFYFPPHSQICKMDNSACHQVVSSDYFIIF